MMVHAAITMFICSSKSERYHQKSARCNSMAHTAEIQENTIRPHHLNLFEADRRPQQIPLTYLHSSQRRRPLLP